MDNTANGTCKGTVDIHGMLHMYYRTHKMCGVAALVNNSSYAYCPETCPYARTFHAYTNMFDPSKPEKHVECMLDRLFYKAVG